MKRFFIILSAALGPVAITFGQEDDTKAHVMASSSTKLARPFVIDIKAPSTRAPLIDSAFSTYPMPNSYRGDNCVPIPNAYRGDNSVPMPNVYRGPIIRRHHADPADSTQHPLRKYERKKEEEHNLEQPESR